MREILFCNSCKKATIRKIKDSCCGYYCPSCDEWTVITSYFSEMQLDFTNYTVRLLCSSLPELELLRFLSKKLNKNFMQIKEKIGKSEYLIYEGEASDLMELLKKIQKSDTVTYQISPDFPYVID